MNDGMITIIFEHETNEIPDPYRNYQNIPKNIPFNVKISTYWNRRIKDGDVKIYKEEKKEIIVKKINKKVKGE